MEERSGFIFQLGHVIYDIIIGILIRTNHSFLFMLNIPSLESSLTKAKRNILSMLFISKHVCGSKLSLILSPRSRWKYLKRLSLTLIASKTLFIRCSSLIPSDAAGLLCNNHHTFIWCRSSRQVRSKKCGRSPPSETIFS